MLEFPIKSANKWGIWVGEGSELSIVIVVPLKSGNRLLKTSQTHFTVGATPSGAQKLSARPDHLLQDMQDTLPTIIFVDHHSSKKSKKMVQFSDPVLDQYQC